MRPQPWPMKLTNADVLLKKVIRRICLSFTSTGEQPRRFIPTNPSVLPFLRRLPPKTRRTCWSKSIMVVMVAITRSPLGTKSRVHSFDRLLENRERIGAENKKGHFVVNDVTDLQQQ